MLCDIIAQLKRRDWVHSKTHRDFRIEDRVGAAGEDSGARSCLSLSVRLGPSRLRLAEQLLEPADEGDKMAGNHRPQRDYVIEAINDLLADEEAQVFEPTQNQELGTHQAACRHRRAPAPPSTSSTKIRGRSF